MPTDWDKWNVTTARLGALKWHVGQMKQEAGKIHEIIDAMCERPSFETEAEADLKILKIEIDTLSAFVKACIEIYHKLPETA